MQEACLRCPCRYAEGLCRKAGHSTCPLLPFCDQGECELTLGKCQCARGVLQYKRHPDSLQKKPHFYSNQEIPRLHEPLPVPVLFSRHFSKCSFLSFFFLYFLGIMSCFYSIPQTKINMLVQTKKQTSKVGLGVTVNRTFKNADSLSSNVLGFAHMWCEAMAGWVAMPPVFQPWQTHTRHTWSESRSGLRGPRGHWERAVARAASCLHQRTSGSR